MVDSQLNPFLLAANVPEPDSRLLPLLRADPALAARQDSHGYSLLHAAASYNHLDLLKKLVQEFRVDVNLTDEDGETCLFVVETVEVAKCLVEELKVDTMIQNNEGMIASEKIADEDDYPEVATYLQSHNAHCESSASRPSTTAVSSDASHPPPLPPNMNISINATTEDQLGDVLQADPDPEFRRRIEELASKENFNSEEGQRELRELITDAVRGVSHEDREVRRRVA